MSDMYKTFQNGSQSDRVEELKDRGIEAGETLVETVSGSPALLGAAITLGVIIAVWGSIRIISGAAKIGATLLCVGAAVAGAGYLIFR